MKLAIQMLDSDSTVNNLMSVNQIEVSPGETATVLFQLINSSSKQRYMPAAGATMTARMVSSNNANTISKIPSQPFSADDRSVWSFSLSSADTAKLSGVNIEIVLTEGANVKKVWAQSTLIVSPNSPFKA